LTASRDPRIRPNVILGVLTLVGLMTSYVEAMVVPSLPHIESALSATDEEAAWIVSAYLVVGAAIAPLFGKMGDVYGKRRLYLISLALYSVAVLMAGFVPNVYYLIAARAVQGFGFALFPLGLAIVTDVFPRERVAVAQGILSATFAIGMTVGMIAGAYIEEYLGWRAMFHTAFAISIVMLILASLLLWSPPPVARERIDFASTVLLASATTAILVYLTEAPYRGWLSPGQLSLLVTGFALFGGFIAYGSRSTRVLIRFDLLKRRNVMVANLLGLLSGVIMFLLFMGVVYYAEELPPYGLGLSVISAAMTLLPATLAMIFIAPLVGAVTSSLGPRPVLIYGSLVSALGFYLFVWDRASPTALVLDSFVTGVGVVSTTIPIVNMVAVSMPPDSVSVGLGFNTMVRFLGASVGPVLAATLLTDYRAYAEYIIPHLGTLTFTEGGPQAFNMIFYIGSAISIVMVVISLFTKNYRVRGSAPLML